MAEPSSQDRNLPASQRKIAKAREEGQVARSRDLAHFAAVGVGGAFIVAAAPLAGGWLHDALRQALRFDAAALRDSAAMGERLGGLTLALLAIVGPVGAVAMVAAIAGGLACGGWNWTLKPLAPKFGKLDPISGIGRVFSKQQLIDALKASLLALILGAIGAFYLRAHLGDFASLLALPLPGAIAGAAATVQGGLLLLALALLVFALIDVPLQRKLAANRLKMSHQELKQEHKELEGNAEIKVKVRARMREMTRRRMMAAVPQADLVVMNPTHYAVALKYDEAAMAAPRVVAKGADLLALRIRDLAGEHRVPVLRSPMLARALYAHAKLDHEIPAALFAAVAQVLAYVYQLRAALAGQAPMPGDLPELDVPEELDPHLTPVEMPEDLE
jgi:flagellar biosynthetic protein FlhB